MIEAGSCSEHARHLEEVKAWCTQCSMAWNIKCQNTMCVGHCLGWQQGRLCHRLAIQKLLAHSLPGATCIGLTSTSQVPGGLNKQTTKDTVVTK